MVKCNDGYKLLEKEVCYPSEGNQMQEKLLSHLVEIDASLKAGNNFIRWGSEVKTSITAHELMTYFTPKSESTVVDTNEVSQAVDAVLKTIGQTGNDDYCLRERFTVEQRNGSMLNFMNKNEVIITSKRLGPTQDAAATKPEQ